MAKISVLYFRLLEFVLEFADESTGTHIISSLRMKSLPTLPLFPKAPILGLRKRGGTSNDVTLSDSQNGCAAFGENPPNPWFPLVCN